MLAAVMMPFISNAQNELTVCTGTATNNYVPVYGFYTDAYLNCQVIYPDSLLEDMAGQTITGISFAISTPSGALWQCEFEVRLMEVNYSSFEADTFVNTSTATLVYTGELDGTGTMMDIEFDQPYTYNGGNLLLEIINTETGNYSSIYFYGITAINAAVQGYSYTSSSAISPTYRDFRPQATFTYGSTSTEPEPQGFTVADGLSVSGHFPVWGLYNDAYTRAQMIYPAQMLADITDMSFDSLSFFIQTPANYEWQTSTSEAHFVVKIKEVDFAQYTDTAYEDMTDAVTVYEGYLSGTGHYMTIAFDQPYTYRGGNLLIEVSNMVKSNYASCFFYGTVVNNASIYGYSYLDWSDADMALDIFLPKMCIGGLEEATPLCSPVENLVANDETSTTATISWSHDNNAVRYVVEYVPGNIDISGYSTLDITDAGGRSLYSYENHIDLTGLTPATTYSLRVQADCDDNGGYSDYQFLFFETEEATGIDLAESNTLTVYPNPASDIVSITFAENGVQGDLTLVDINGKTVYATQVSGPKAEINVSNLPKGVYFVRCTFGQRNAVKKLVVE